MDELSWLDVREAVTSRTNVRGVVDWPSVAAELTLMARALATADKPLTGRDEPTARTLWEAIAASLTAAETHKTAIYRGEGVQPADALSGIEKHIAAGLAARVMYERLRAPTAPALDVDDAKHLADAAVHMADHMDHLDAFCEEARNVRHFAGKVLAALSPTTESPEP